MLLCHFGIHPTLYAKYASILKTCPIIRAAIWIIRFTLKTPLSQVGLWSIVNIVQTNMHYMCVLYLTFLWTVTQSCLLIMLYGLGFVNLVRHEYIVLIIYAFSHRSFSLMAGLSTHIILIIQQWLKNTFIFVKTAFKNVHDTLPRQ